MLVFVGSCPDQRELLPDQREVLLDNHARNNERIALRAQPSSCLDYSEYSLSDDQILLIDTEKGDDDLTWHYVRFQESGVEGWTPEEDAIILLDIYETKDATELLREIAEGNSYGNSNLLTEAGLNFSQTEILRSLDGKFTVHYQDCKDSIFRVILPQYIPSGFHLQRFQYEDRIASSSENLTQFDISYNLTYRNQYHQCFSLVVKATQGGGTSTYRNTIVVRSQDLGDLILEYADFDRQAEGGITFSADFVDNGLAYIFTSPDKESMPNCEWVGISESVRILESLSFLTESLE
jgi:hypothetical protein